MPEDLCQIATPASEDIEIAGVGIPLQALLNLQSQTLHAAPHIGVASRDPDPDAVSGSSPAQNIEDPPQRVSIDVLVDADTLAATEFDLDQAPASPGRNRRWGFSR